MRRLKKNYYLGLFFTIVGLLGLLKWAFDIQTKDTHAEKTPVATDTAEDTFSPITKITDKEEYRHHPIYSVPSFSRSFPDLQDTHAESARKWGVPPVRNRMAAEDRKNELVFIGSNPYYKIDPGMNSSIPYLVPHAADVLQIIAQNYLDSLHIKGIPLHKILVSSVLRTEEDVEKLQKTNPNASPESCHRYGTTFDIAYNRYHTVTPPGTERRSVQNDTLKWILAEVLRDAREDGLCHIKYEVKQGCFHITAK